MSQKNPALITPEEGEQLIAEILGHKNAAIGSLPKKKKHDEARLLFIDRCTNCHPVNMILMANKSKGEWKETVIRMRDNAPELLLGEDLPIILAYLTEKATILRDDVAAEIMVNKCLICHEGGRILLERKSKRDWGKTVVEMRNLARVKFTKDWFTHHESKIIVDLLVKTQGL